MARMTPPDSPVDTRSRAEVLLYWKLKDQLNDSFHVQHSRSWQFPKEKYGRRCIDDGEADFLIFHRDYGVLDLEVKGSSITYDSFHENWYQNGDRMKESPFKQAHDNKWSIVEYCKKKSNILKRKFINYAYAVAFPDIDIVIGNLSPSIDRKLLLLRTDLDNLQDWVINAFNYYLQNQSFQSLGDDGVREIYKLFSPSLQFKKLLVNDIDKEKEIICQLTEQQKQVLEMFRYNRQAKILGCAGSGKTQLAIEKVKRLCRDEIKTLFLCKSINLCNYLKVCLEKEIQDGYCIVDYFESLKLKKVPNIDFIFDAIIIDEGQDLSINDIDWVKQLLYDENTSIFYIFLDNNQKLVKNLNNIKLPNIVLDRNLRNTNPVFEFFVGYIQSFEEIKPSGVEGRKIVIKELTNIQDLQKLLYKDLDDLIRKQQIKVNDIIILTNQASSHSVLKEISRKEITLRQGK